MTSVDRRSLPEPQPPRMFIGGALWELGPVFFIIMFLFIMPLGCTAFVFAVFAQFLSTGAALVALGAVYTGWVALATERYHKSKALCQWSYGEAYFNACWNYLADDVRANLQPEYENMLEAAKTLRRDFSRKPFNSSPAEYKLMLGVIEHAEVRYASDTRPLMQNAHERKALALEEQKRRLEYIEEVNRIQAEVVKELS